MPDVPDSAGEVVEDGSPFDVGFTVDADQPGATDEETPKEAPESGETEVAASETTSAGEGAEETSETQTAEETEPQPPTEPGVPSTAPEKFNFLGKEYRDLKHAEEVLGSGEGRIRVEQERVSKAEGQLQEYYQYVQETSSKNDELIARLNELEGKETKEEEAPKKFVDSVDWEEISKVAEIARQQGYDPAVVTQKMFAEQLDGYIEKTIESRIGPIAETHQATEVEDRIEDAMDEVALWAADTGKYPELDNSNKESFSEDFIRSWYQTLEGFARSNPLFGFSADGVDYAYRLTRDAFEAAPKDGAPTSTTEPAAPTDNTPGRDTRGRFTKARNAAADVVNESKSTVKTDPTMDTEEDDPLMKSIRSVKSVREGDFDLGFVP